MLLKVTETDTFTMNNSQKDMDYYHSVYPFGNHFDGYSMHQNYFQNFTNGYLDNSNTENHETWPRGSYHSNVYDNTDETASKDCRFKRKEGKIHNDQFIPDHCCQIKEEIDDSQTSCLWEQRGQLELGQSPALSHHGRDYSTDFNPYRSDNGVVIVELNGVQYDIDTCDTLEDQFIEPCLYKPQTGITCLGYATLPKTIDADAPMYKHSSTFTTTSTKSTRKSKLKRSHSIRQKRLPRGCRLWEFLRGLLLNPEYNPTHIKWTNRDHGEFKLIQTSEIARMWGEQKNNPGMTYEKLSRAMRYYYKREILAPVLGRRLVYKFGKRSYGWEAA